MATVAQIDLNSEIPVSVSTQDGIVSQTVRRFRVTGLTAGTNAPFEALSAIGLPRRGFRHPSDTTLVLQNYSVEMDGPTNAFVDCIYQKENGEPLDPENDELQQPEWEGGITLEQITIYKDKDGNPLTVTYKGQTVAAPVTVLQPRPSLTVPKIIATKYPGAEMRNWVPTVNKTPWNKGAAKTWMCVAAPFRVVDNFSDPPRYRFIFQFIYKAEGHKPEGVYLDPTTGVPPSDWFEQGAFVSFDHYPEIDFNDLFPASEESEAS